MSTGDRDAEQRGTVLLPPRLRAWLIKLKSGLRRGLSMSDDILDKAPVQADVRIPYGTDPNQFGDLYLPRHGGRDLPTVVFIHGGFWRSQFASPAARRSAGAGGR